MCHEIWMFFNEIVSFQKRSPHGLWNSFKNNFFDTLDHKISSKPKSFHENYLILCWVHNNWYLFLLVRQKNVPETYLLDFCGLFFNKKFIKCHAIFIWRRHFIIISFVKRAEKYIRTTKREKKSSFYFI